MPSYFSENELNRKNDESGTNQFQKSTFIVEEGEDELMIGNTTERSNKQDENKQNPNDNKDSDILKTTKNSNKDISQNCEEDNPNMTTDQEQQESEVSNNGEVQNQNITHLMKIQHFDVLRGKNKSQNYYK